IRQNNFMEFPNYNFAINIRPNDWDEIKVILNKLKKNELIKLKKISKISRGIEIGKSNSKIISKEDIKRNPNLNKNPNLVKVVSIDNILSYKIDYKNKRFPEKYIVFEPDNLRIYKNKSNYRTPKILIKRISKKIIAALDFKENYYCLDSVQILQLTSNTNYNIYFLLAVLNSEIFNKYYQLIYGNYKKLFTRVNKSYLIDLPIPKVNIEEQNEIASIVKELLKFENIKSNEFKELKKEIDKRIQYHYLDMYG
ncbi:MAG: TaqI-like C-terminal specificity domain-containing protein, partial [Candidatus Helarchaeota archaeon]